MPLEIIMPKVDMDMSSGRVSAWHAAEGDLIAKGDPLFDIETDKAAMEVESPGDGVLRRPVAVGSEIPIGQPVAWLYAAGEIEQTADRSPAVAVSAQEESGTDTAAGANEFRGKPEQPPVDSRASPAEAMSNAGPNKVRATPLARRLARNAGLDVGSITGTGPRGRVQAPDVRAILEAPSPASEPVLSFIPESGNLVVTRSGRATGSPVVFIHGFASDTPAWALVESQIATHPRIRIDLPSHGKSPKLGITSFEHLATIVGSAFDRLQLDKAHLIGHDLGGALALAIADARAQSVASLTLIAPAGLGPEIHGGAIHGVARASKIESLGPWLRTFVSDEAMFSESYVRLIMNSRADAGLRTAQQSMANALFPDGVQAFDLKAELARIRAPTRILWGKSDRIIPWEHALRAPGHVALHLLEGVGHLPHIEAYEIVGSIISSQVSR